ncbi:hypothetical protein B14911_14162 [Bacillus sp. NRRL B-14911]|nr:hypothetical protein B14911_14162 [Bacillus sp. NRRL B-14911]
MRFNKMPLLMRRGWDKNRKGYPVGDKIKKTD